MGRQSNIVFSNLRAEMARRKVGIQDIAQLIGVARDTASNKLSGKRPISLDEAFKIEAAYFQDCDVRYLFKELIPDKDNAAP